MALTPQVVAIITTIGSLVVPPLVSFLKRQSWSAQLKQLLAGVLSTAVAAAAIAIVAPKDFGLSFVTLAGLVYAGGQLVYGAYFKGSSTEVLLAAVGSKNKKTPLA